MSGRDKIIVVALVGLVAAATAFALVSEVPPRSSGEPAPGGTYTEAVIGGTRALNPLYAVTSVDRDVAALLFTGLTRFDQHGEIVPDLAREFRVEGDGTVWAFTIREGARWHDGEPVTTDDVAYTVGVLQDRAYSGPFASAFAGVKVERVGVRSLRFVLPDVYAPFLEATTVPLLPAHILKGVNARALAFHAFNAKPVGTGPFKFESRDEKRVVLARNDDFYRAAPDRRRPYLDKIVLRAYPDNASALQALARGEVHAVGGLTASEAERARRARDLALYFLPSDELSVLFFNLAPDRPLFRDRAVRQAIAQAINRSRILQVATEGHGVVVEGPVAPSSWAYQKDAKRYGYAPDEAKRLLDGAGWVDRDGDGVREKGNLVLRFDLLASDDPVRVATAEQISHDLAALGIQANVAALPFPDLVEKRARPRQFEAILLTVVTGRDPDQYAFWHSAQAKDPGYNFTGYTTLALDRALEAARRTLDQAQRRELYAQVFAQLAEDVPAVYLYFADYVYLVDRSVKGLRIAPISEPAGRFWQVEDWFMKERMLPVE